MLMSASAERSSAERFGWPKRAARELPNLPLQDALQLVHLYAERGSPKYEKAAMRWLERYLSEARRGFSTSPRSQRVWPSPSR